MKFWNDMKDAAGDLANRILMLGNPDTGLPERTTVKKFVESLKSLWISQIVGTATDKSPSEKAIKEELFKLREYIEVYSSNQVRNGSFIYDLDNWVILDNSNAVVVKAASINLKAVRLNKGGLSSPFKNRLSVIPGKKYRISILYKIDVGVSIEFGVEGSHLEVRKSLSYDWQMAEIDIIYKNGTGFQIKHLGTDEDLYVTLISMEEVIV